MKNFFSVSKWGGVFLAALCVGFTSCSSDDDEPVVSGGVGGGTPAGGITIGVGGAQIGTKSVVYDVQGRMTASATYTLGILTQSTNITYGDGTITVVDKENDGGDMYIVTHVYQVNDQGLIVSGVTEEELTYLDDPDYKPFLPKTRTTYTYDAEGKLISSWEGMDYSNTGNYTETTTITYRWVDGNLISGTWKSGFVETYTYTDYPDLKGLNGFTIYDFGDEDGALYAQGCFGKLSKNLCTSWRGSYNDEGIDVTYTMNGNTVSMITSVEDGVAVWMKFN